MIGLKAVIFILVLSFGKAESSGGDLEGIKSEAKRSINSFLKNLNADIVFVIDSSDDISKRQFDSIKETLIHFVENMNISQSNIKLAVVSFNSSVNTVFILQQYQNNDDTVSAIVNMSFYGGKSLITDAVSYAVNNNFQISNGARTVAKKVLVIITGSVPIINSDVRSKILTKGVGIALIGTNCSLSRTELNRVTGNPKLVLSVTDSTSELLFWKKLKNRLQSLIISEIAESTLYPYGIKFGDSTTVRGDDTGSTMQTFSHPLMFFGKNYTRFYISNNGLISLDTRYTTYSQQRFPMSYPAVIAIYWKDLLDGYEASVYYRQINRGSSQQNTSDSAILLERVSSDINRLTKTTFKATWLLITTWDKVQDYGARRFIYTFQCVVAASNNETYVILNYKDTIDNNRNHAQVGFNRDRTHFYNLNGTRTVNVQLLNSSSNVGIPGQWIFRVDGETVEDYGAVLKASNNSLGVSEETAKTDIQLMSPDCVFHHNPTYTFCDCPHGISGRNCELNVTSCFDNFKQIPNAFIRCGYDKNDEEERCFINCQSGYQPSTTVQLIGVFHCTSCETKRLLSSNVTNLCVPTPGAAFG